MDVAGDEFSRGAAKTIGDRDHQTLLHRHHIGEIGMILQRVHDRQFGGAGIAEQMRDALVLQKREKSRAPGNAIFHPSPPARRTLTRGVLASWPISKDARNGARSWLQCVAARRMASLFPLLRRERWGEGLLPQNDRREVMR